MKKLRPPITPSKALEFVNTNCIAIDELQPDLLFLPILALKNTLQYKIQRRLHGQQSTNVIRFNFNLDLDYRQAGQDSRLLEERQWQCRENHDSCGCQEQDQYHWVLFTNCQLGECCNGAANRWCAQTILQFHFLRQFPYQVMCLAVLLCWRWRSQACSMVPANLNSLSRHFLCAKGFHQFPTVFSRLACQNEKIDLETKQISRCIYNIF